MKTFYTKCGREFLKSSTASVTGYRMKEDDIQCHGDESSGKIPCPFRKAVTKGWPQVFDHWECRAGSKKPNHKNEWIGSLEDKNTIHIRSLNNDFLESIMEFCYLHPHLAASFNQDLDDCRCVISVCCSPNKKGIAAKKELVDEFFNKKTDAENTGIVCDGFNEKFNQEEGEKTMFLDENKKCKKQDENCNYYCDHNEACALLVTKGRALDNMVKSIGAVDCDLYRNMMALDVPGDNNNESLLEQRLEMIRENVNNIIDNYIKIGFILLDMRNLKLYEERGYSSLVECVEVELGMKKSTCYNLMRIAEKFGNPITKSIADNYQEYGYVQLLEMTTMSEEEMTQVSPEMSRRDIKKLKNSNRLEKLEPDLIESGLTDVDEDISEPEESNETENNVIIESSNVFNIEPKPVPEITDDKLTEPDILNDDLEDLDEVKENFNLEDLSKEIILKSLIDRRNENKLCYLKAETSEKKMEYFIRFQEVNDILFLLLNLERDEI